MTLNLKSVNLHSEVGASNNNLLFVFSKIQYVDIGGGNRHFYGVFIFLVILKREGNFFERCLRLD